MYKIRTFWVGVVCAAMASLGALGQSTPSRPAPPSVCVNTDSANSDICLTMVTASFDAPGTPYAKVTLWVHFINTAETSGTEPDFYQVRFSETTNDGGLTYISQDSVVGKSWSGDWKVTHPYLPGVEGPPYLIQVQMCNNGGINGGALCYRWANVTYTPPTPQYIAPPTGRTSPGSGPNATNHHATPNQAPPAPPNMAEVPRPCIQGYVWRQVVTNDYVCVTPQTRDQAAADNEVKDRRIAANGMCIQGYVWREAVPLDHVCVTPQNHAQAQQDNAALNQRVVSQSAP